MANYRKPCDDDCYAPEHEHHKDTKVVLSCGTGNGLTLPVGGPPDGIRQMAPGGYPPSLVPGSVVLDTRGLNDPTVKIDFSSLINFNAAGCQGGFDLRIIFQLSRSCDGGAKIPLSTWVYERNAEVALGGLVAPDGFNINVDFKDPFGFVWCECRDCGTCCTYLVEIIDILTFDIESASITNVGLTALAVGK